MLSERRLRVRAVGLVPPGPSGVRDYGETLAGALAREGVDVEQIWLENPGTSLRATLRVSRELLRLGRRLRDTDAVLWHYSVFAYAFRGVAMPGALFGLVLRSRKIPVLTIVHEPRYPWGRRGVRGNVQAVTQGAALPLVVAGSSALVVTTAERAQVGRRAKRRPVVLPMFATIGVGGFDAVVPSDGRFRIGVIAYTGDGARPDVLLDAIAPGTQTEIVMLGAPGADVPEAQRWLALAEDRGMTAALSFTGIVSAADLSRELRAADLVVFANDLGPSSRRSTIANALAHGAPLVALDGPERWDTLVEHAAVVVVPPDATSLRRAIDKLRNNPSERTALSERAQRFYAGEMALERTSSAIAAELRRVAQTEE